MVSVLNSTSANRGIGIESQGTGESADRKPKEKTSGHRELWQARVPRRHLKDADEKPSQIRRVESSDKLTKKDPEEVPRLQSQWLSLNSSSP